MKRNRTVLLLLAVLVTTALTFAGCAGANKTPVETTTSITTSTAREPTFDLTDWRIDGASFDYDYSMTDPSPSPSGLDELEVSLTGPEGKELSHDQRMLEDGSDWGQLSMTDYGAVAEEPGPYKLTVKTETGNVIFEKTLMLSKPSVRIVDVTPHWKYLKGAYDDAPNELDYATIDLVNDGDLPVYTSIMPINVDDGEVAEGQEDSIGSTLNHGSFSCNITGFSNTYITGGTKTLTVSLYDNSNVLIAEKQIEITLPD